MSRLQPIGQKKLTNICVVRLKKTGKRFEVAAYRNTVIAWRTKVETDIDEVLQAHTIYASVEKGVLAKNEDLIAAFGTDDEDRVCVEILNKGEFQVSDQERQMQTDALFRDVASRVTAMVLNPASQRPYPLSMIERAMRETLHFAPQPSKSAKQQALAVVRQLQQQQPFPVTRAKMRLRLLVPAARLDAAQAALRDVTADGEGEGDGAAAAAASASEVVVTRVDAAAEAATGGMAAVDCLADPRLFRAIGELASAHGGTVQVLEHTSQAEQQPGADGAAEPGAAGEPGAAAGFRGGRWGVKTEVAESLRAAADPTAVAAAASAAAAAPARRGGGGRGAAGASGRAERLFRVNLRSAEQGDPVAQLEVGKAYAGGVGVEPDADAARRWLKEAQLQGVNAAAAALEKLEVAA